MTAGPISIIVIAYNEENYIQRILDSLANQSYKNFEVIVVDSNSTDNTERISMQYSLVFNEFNYLKLNCTNGPGYGRNRGAEIAKYNRLLFLDADTKLDNTFIEESLKEIERRNIDLATCLVRIVEENIAASISTRFLNIMLMILSPLYPAAYGACIFSTRDAHSKINGFDERIAVCEDCNYVKKARKEYKFRILKKHFYTSDRRAGAEGGLFVLFRYIKIHSYRIFTGREFVKGSIEYRFGDF